MGKRRKVSSNPAEGTSKTKKDQVRLINLDLRITEMSDRAAQKNNGKLDVQGSQRSTDLWDGAMKLENGTLDEQGKHKLMDLWDSAVQMDNGKLGGRGRHRLTDLRDRES